jgi:excisionase family DNA binding protein
MRELENRVKRSIIMADGNNRLSQAAKRMRTSRPTLYALLEAHDMASLRVPAGEEEKG